MSVRDIRTGRIGPGKVARPKPAEEDNALPPSRGGIIPIGGNDPFTLFHGHNWTWCPDYKGGMWLPDISALRHTVGCNGTLENGDATAYIVGAQRKGLIIIHNGDTRLPDDPVVIDGEEYPGYRYYDAHYEVRGGGAFHCLPHVRFVWQKGGRSVTPVHTSEWADGFREALWTCGIVPPMGEDVLQSHIALQRDKASRDQRALAHGIMTSETVKARAEERDALIAAWLEAYAKQFGGRDVEGKIAGPTTSTKPQPEAAMAAQLAGKGKKAAAPKVQRDG